MIQTQLRDRARTGLAPTSAYRAQRLMLVGALVLTAATRIAYLLSRRMEFNGDEAATGIMVRQIQAGHFIGFFAGQHYGGTIEQYVQAFGYSALRLPENMFTLRLTQVAFSVVTCALVYACAKVILRSPNRAVSAAYIFAVAPWFNVLGGGTSLGFYAAGQTLGMLALYLALKLSQRPEPKTAFFFGLVVGFAFWTALTSLYVVIPVLLWALVPLRRSVKLLRLAVIGAVIGASPVVQLIIWQHKLPLPGATPVHLLPWVRLGRLFDPILRETLGVTYTFGRGGLPRPLQVFIQIAAIGIYLVALYRHRHGIASLVRGRADRRSPLDIVLLCPVVIAVFYAASPNSWFFDNPRYVFTTYPLLCIGVIAALPRTRGRFASALALVLVASAVSSYGFFTSTTNGPSAVSRKATFARVQHALATRGETAAYADYWTAMPLQYYAGSQLDVAVDMGVPRFPETERAVADAPTLTYIATTLDASSQLLEASLRAHHITYRVTQIDFVKIYDDLSTQARPCDLAIVGVQGCKRH